MDLRRRRFLRLSGAAALASVSRSARAQNWPTRNIRLVVGYAPDGGLDSAAHILGNRLSEIWGQRVIIESTSGNDVRIAFDAVAHAAPDGHTMLTATGAPEVNRFLFSKLTFDPAVDFTPVSLIGTFPDILVVSSSSPLDSVEKFIAFAKSRPGMLSWASPGTGTPPHLAGELFKLMAGIKMTHVPYDGITEYLISDLVAGRVDAMFDTAGSLLPLVRSHQLRGLAVTSGKRFPNQPELPTVAESGVPGYDVSSWYGLYLPARTPPEVVRTINSDIVVLLRDSALKAQFAALAILVASSRPEELAARNSAAAGAWKSLIEVANIKVE
jgi:tripartite-type tricarboxylate transporter receptor subunit TctC